MGAVRGGRGGLQEGEEGKGGEVDTCDVCCENGGPVGDGFRVPEGLLEGSRGGGRWGGFGAGDAGVGDCVMRGVTDVGFGDRRGELVLRRLMYFSFLEMSATRSSRSSLEVTSQGPTLMSSFSPLSRTYPVRLKSTLGIRALTVLSRPRPPDCGSLQHFQELPCGVR